MNDELQQLLRCPFCGGRFISDMPHVVRTESPFREQYLQKLRPNRSGIDDEKSSERDKCLALIASSDKTLFRAHGSFEDWPHALGFIDISPLFSKEGEEGNAKKFRFEFPCEGHAYEGEDVAHKNYAPEQCLVPHQRLKELDDGERSEAMEEHLRRKDIPGMPCRHLHPGSGFTISSRLRTPPGDHP